MCQNLYKFGAGERRTFPNTLPGLYLIQKKAWKTWKAACIQTLNKISFLCTYLLCHGNSVSSILQCRARGAKKRHGEKKARAPKMEKTFFFFFFLHMLLI